MELNKRTKGTAMMKLVKGGLLAAIVSIMLAGLGAQSALADPIGGPWAASGEIFLDNGMGGTECAFSMEGFTDGDQVDDIAFSGCVGTLLTIDALPSWTIDWDPTGTRGTLEMEFLGDMIMIVSCLYRGSVPVEYSGGRLIGTGGVTYRTSGGFPCTNTLVNDFDVAVTTH